MKISFTLFLCLLASLGFAQDKVVVYSARHYGGDADLFGAFTKKTGIKVEVIEAKGGALLEKIKNEGKNSPADVLITVDAARLGAADAERIFQPVTSETLTSAIPEDFRHPQGHWFGFGKRVRVTVIAPDRVKPSDIPDYASLAQPEFRRRIVVRSSSNVYNQSLLADLIERMGEKEAQVWAAGIVRNMARRPKGNDRAQIKAVASGEADVAIVNHYYFARMLNSSDAEEVAAAKKVAVHFPGQGTNGDGVHVNISGAGLLKNAPNKEAGIKLLEFMASKEGQALFIKPSWEYPVVDGVEIGYEDFPARFKGGKVSASKLAENNAKALKTFDRVDWR